jgi:hypothetical protein
VTEPVEPLSVVLVIVIYEVKEVADQDEAGEDFRPLEEAVDLPVVGTAIGFVGVVRPLVDVIKDEDEYDPVRARPSLLLLVLLVLLAVLVLPILPLFPGDSEWKDLPTELDRAFVVCPDVDVEVLAALAFVITLDRSAELVADSKYLSPRLFWVSAEIPERPRCCRVADAEGEVFDPDKPADRVLTE